MALSINTNICAMIAQRHMVKTDNALSTSLERLASGIRLNKAADDASGMLIADSLKSQALGLGQAIRNANDGISMVQIADSSLAESINLVNTIKQKAIQAAQDGQTLSSRLALQADIDKIMEELGLIATTSSFNGQKLLSGAFNNKQVQVGSFSQETISLTIPSTTPDQIGHINAARLVVQDQQPGVVSSSIHSNALGRNFLLPPTLLRGADEAAGLLADAIAAGQRLLIVADYDCDGATACAVGMRALSAFA